MQKQILHMKYQCVLHPEVKTNDKGEFIEHLATHKIQEGLSYDEKHNLDFSESGIPRTDLLLEWQPTQIM